MKIKKMPHMMSIKVMEKQMGKKKKPKKPRY